MKKSNNTKKGIITTVAPPRPKVNSPMHVLCVENNTSFFFIKITVVQNKKKDGFLCFHCAYLCPSVEVSLAAHRLLFNYYNVLFLYIYIYHLSMCVCMQVWVFCFFIFLTMEARLLWRVSHDPSLQFVLV